MRIKSQAKSQNNREVINRVERAVADLRRGKPVIMEGKKPVLIQAVEGVDLPELKAYFGTGCRLLIAPARYAALTGKAAKAKAYAADIALTPAGIRHLPEYVGLETGKAKPPAFSAVTDAAALTLMKHAELLPAALTGEAPKKSDYVEVSAKDIAYYEEAVAYSLEVVCTAPLTLKDANKAEIIGFRPASGGREHYAIVVGNGLKVKNPLIRVHSSCYTGDLLASLTCDCRDQLHEAIHFMADEGGGIVLYLMQEGRGIGLVNKLRAYHLQAEGLDTVEANRALGFDDDERPFLVAAEMLKRLKVKQVRLLTNNPRKVKELQRFGIKVSARVPHVMQAHEHRARYMASKSSRLGHLMNG